MQVVFFPAGDWFCKHIYREYMANNYQGEVPTLKDLYHSLLKQPEPEARGLALSSELFITGSLNTLQSAPIFR